MEKTTSQFQHSNLESVPELKFDIVKQSASEMPEHFSTRDKVSEQLISSPLETNERDFPKEAEEEKKQSNYPKNLLCES